ncbi:hypothetical protein M9H77_35818 [Catharanthus roseus]|uniref:Uncharacterized protein n=1 Tax=Catharanthus roseus TaxID=4058 RepID=A0ACB9ZQU6_CATRO|nr:hypothetical protein M9H77_35818 [Catharanthus roseus]
MDLAAWKPPPSDLRKLLTLNVDRLHPSSRATTHISAVMQKRFIGPYHSWSEVSPDVCNMWWGEFQEVKVRDLMRDLLGDARAARKRPVWIAKMFWEHIIKYWKTDLTYKFSKSRHLEELHKHHTGDKKRQYVDFQSEEFWTKFHKARQKAKVEAATTGTPMPYALHCGRLYGAGSKAAHLRAKSSRVADGLPPCCLEVKQRIMRRVEAVVSNVCTAFNEYMRQFVEQSHLPYTSMPPIVDIVRAAVAIVPSTSLSTAAVAVTSDARVYFVDLIDRSKTVGNAVSII